MQDKKKNKAQLLEEINELRREVAEMKAGAREMEQFKLAVSREGLTLDSLAEIVLYEDLDHRILWANRAAIDTFGLTLEEMKGRTCYEMWQMRPEPCPMCPVREAVETAKPVFTEMWAPDGKYWNVRAYPVKDDKGNVVGAIEVALDITERKQTQDELLKSEQRCRLIIEHASDAIFQIDSAGRIIEANRAACDSLGRTHDELMTMSISQIDLDWDREKLAPFLATLATGEIKTVEGTHLRKNGTTFPAEIRVTKIEVDESPVILALVRDITQRRRIERALAESEEALKAELEAETPTADSIHVSGIDIKWNLKDGTCTFDKLPVAMMWIKSTLASLISGGQTMVGTERFALALQSQGRKSVEDDWQIISQFPDFETGFKAIANIAAAAGWGDWNLVSIETEKKECRFRVYNSWEGRCQKALGVSWGSGLVAGKFAGYASVLFKTNCWADQTAFLAAGDGYDEFVVHPSERSVEHEIEDLLKTDQATRADMAVAFQKLQKEIAERKRTEELLRESEQKYRDLYDTAIVGLYRSAISDGKILAANQALADLMGYDSPEDVMANFRTSEHYADPSQREVLLGLLREKGKVENFEFAATRADGSPIDIAISARLYPEEGYLEGVVIDITKRKKATQALEKAEREKAMILDSIGEHVIYQDEDGRIISANRAAAESIGATPEDLVGRYCYELWQARSCRCEGCPIERALVTQEPEEAEMASPDGRVWQVRGYPVRDEKGDVIGAVEVTLDISERQRAETALRASEEKYRRLVEMMAEGLGVTDADYAFTYVNSALAKMLGLTPEEMIGRHVLEFTHPDSKEAMAEQIELRKKGVVKPYDITWIAKDGSKVYTIASPQGFFDPNGNFIGSFGVITDITERKRTERELMHSRQMLQNVLDTIPARVFWKDRNYAFLGCNKLFAHDAGRESPAELIGKTDYDMPWTKQEADFFREHDRRVVESDTPEYHIIESQLHADGTRAWLDTSKVPIHDENGSVVGILGTYEDITERRRTEDQLRISQERLSLAFEAASDGLWDWNLDTNKVYFSPRYYTMLGYKPDEFEAFYDAWADLIHPADREYAVGAVRKCIEEKQELFEVDFRMKTRSGEWCWILARGKVVERDEEGRPVRIVGTHVDITERKLANKKIEDLARFPSENPDAVLRIAKDGRLLYANRASQSLLHEWNCRIQGPVPEQWCRMAAEVLDSAEKREIEIVHQNKVLLFVLAPAVDAGYVNAYGRDITERRQTEEDRKRLLKALATKNEELESIVYVSSHDLRSPLVNIQGFSGELHRCCQQLTSVLEKADVEERHRTEITRILDEEIPSSLGYISNSTTKMDVLLRGLLRLSRLGSVALKIRRLNMNSMLRDVKKNMQYQIKQSGARVIVEELPPCKGDAAQVSQIFANLLDNAIKYRHPERSSSIRVFGTVENGTAVYGVKDNGVGIAPGHIDKVFEIFHRLDPHSEVAGEGLGLTIVRRMLDLMDGSIRVESEVGKGSTFYVTLPAAEENEQ